MKNIGSFTYSLKLRISKCLLLVDLAKHKRAGIKIFTLIFLSLILNGQLTAQFYIQGGITKHLKNKELETLGFYENLLPWYRLGFGHELKFKKIFVLDAGVHLMNINKDMLENDFRFFNIATPIQFKVRPISLMDLGLGFMPTFTTTKTQSIFESPVQYFGLASFGINLHKRFSIEGLYNYGLKYYKDVNYYNMNGGFLGKFDLRDQSYSITAKIKF